MLSESEINEIDHEVSKFEFKQGACIDALLIVQQHRGWVSDEALKDIASHLEMSTAELDSVATFYNLIYRKPVGKHVIRLCDSVSCYIMGYEKIKQTIQDELGISWGQTTSDQKFTLLPAQCLGTCDHAPAMMIGDALYRDLQSDALVQILRKYKGEKQ